MARLGTDYAADAKVEKFYAQRYRLWTKFDSGVWMTDAAWYSVTPEKIAEHVAQRLRRAFDDDNNNNSAAPRVVVDLFCGCGGNAVQLARVFDRVIAVDFDHDTLVAAKVNAGVYGVADKIDFLCQDVFDLDVGKLPPHRCAVHLSPPWGGEDYMLAPVYSLEKDVPPALGGRTFADLMALCRRVSPNISLYLPRQVLVDDVAQFVPTGSSFEFEAHYVNDRCKALSVYLGKLVNQPKTPYRRPVPSFGVVTRLKPIQRRPTGAGSGGGGGSSARASAGGAHQQQQQQSAQQDD